MNKEQQINYLVEEVGALKVRLSRPAQGWGQYNGNNSFERNQSAITEEIELLEKELERLTATNQTRESEEKIELTISGNVVKEVVPEPIKGTKSTFQPVVVDLEELKRVEDFLNHAAEFARNSGNKVSFTNIKGLKDSKPLRTFILKGLPYIIGGLESILCNENYGQRLNDLQQHEARVRLLKEKKVDSYNKISIEILEKKMANIQEFKYLYQY